MTNKLLLLIPCLCFHNAAAGLPSLIGSKLMKLSAIFGKSLSRQNVANFDDLAFSILELVPGFFENFFGGGSSKEMTEVINALDSISSIQKKIWDDIYSLSRDLQFSILQNSIADDAKEIDSCTESYRGYIEFKSHEYETELMNCRIQANVRSIGSILKGEKVSVKSTRLFDGLLDNDGFCDGELFTKVYSYLLRLLFEGYNALIVSQEIHAHKENISSNISAYLREYRNQMKDIGESMQKYFEKCASCDVMENFIRTAANVSDPEKTFDDLQRKFPWNIFYVFTFKDNTNLQVRSFGTKIDMSKLYSGGNMLQIFSFRSVYFTESFNPSESTTTPAEAENQYCEVLRITYSKEKLVSKYGDKIVLYETSTTQTGEETVYLEAMCDVIQSEKKGLGPCQIDVLISHGNRCFINPLMLCTLAVIWMFIMNFHY